MVEPHWAQAVQRARRLPPKRLHERVDGEHSFIETMRHLLFATDAWLRRAVQGEPSPWHPLGLPHDDHHDDDVPNDRSARRSTRWWRCEPVDHPGYPPPNAYPVRRCLRAVVKEEWQHLLFAERDLAILEST